MKRDSDFSAFSEQGNWNSAMAYAQLKIMKQLYLLDEYQLIAKFGTSELIDEFITDDALKNIARIKALKRLSTTLLLLIDNTKFAVRKEDKKKMQELRDYVSKIESVMPLVEQKKINQKTKSSIILINENNFTKIYNALVSVKEELNTPLNRADLIFLSVEDIDPDKLRDEMIEEMATEG